MGERDKEKINPMVKVLIQKLDAKPTEFVFDLDQPKADIVIKYKNFEMIFAYNQEESFGSSLCNYECELLKDGERVAYKETLVTKETGKLSKSGIEMYKKALIKSMADIILEELKNETL